MNIIEIPSAVVGHVKWFSDFDFRDRPLSFNEITTGYFWFFLVLAAAVIAVLPIADRWLESLKAYADIDMRLRRAEPYTGPIMRYSTAVVLLLTWQARTLLAPELYEQSPWIGWAHFVVAIILLATKANRVAAAGLLGLWLLGVYFNGAFHMLDYLHFVGIAIFIYYCDHEDLKKRELGIPALYFAVGFSLVWLGFEKLVYSGWSVSLLEVRPVLRLGMPVDFFLTGAAFVEIALGVLLILGLLGRPLSLVITLVFICTTLVFGRNEIIGHTPVHAALVVFLIHGEGTVYRAPFSFSRKLWQQCVFAGVSLLAVTLGLGSLYIVGARQEHRAAVETLGEIPEPITSSTQTPVLDSLEIVKSAAGSDVAITMRNFTFVKPLDDGAILASPTTDEGYGIVTIDGRAIALIDGDRSPLIANTERVLDQGVLRLYTPDGRMITDADGTPLLYRLSD